MLFSNFLYFSTNISPTSNVFIVINKFIFELQYFSALVQICLPFNKFLFKFKYFHLYLYIFMFFFTKLHLNSNIFIQIPIFLLYFKYYYALK